jgi:hypothetical protein
MGAAASVEMQKPVDASDIRATNSLDYAASEVKRLRADLGHLAKLAGIDIVVYDASDILLGDDQDFERCVREISHIRNCLQLQSNSARRKTRVYASDEKLSIPTNTIPATEDGQQSSDSSESEEDN